MLQVERQSKVRSDLWLALGFVAGKAGSLAFACKCHGLSIGPRESRLSPLAVWFVPCVQLGDLAGALGAARRIDELVEDDHPLLLRFQVEQRRTRLQGAWAPTPEAAACARAIGEHLGGSSRRVLDVLE